MVTVTIQGVGTGHCALTAREGDGLTVAFANESPQFLSWKGFRQLIAYKTPPAQPSGKPAPKTEDELKS